MPQSELHNFVAERPYLVWWVNDYRRLSEEAVVEATLNYGNWQDVQELFRIVGIERAAEIFRAKSQPSAMGRHNYNERTKQFFARYFDKHAPQHAQRSAH